MKLKLSKYLNRLLQLGRSIAVLWVGLIILLSAFMANIIRIFLDTSLLISGAAALIILAVFRILWKYLIFLFRSNSIIVVASSHPTKPQKAASLAFLIVLTCLGYFWLKEFELKNGLTKADQTVLSGCKFFDLKASICISLEDEKEKNLLALDELNRQRLKDAISVEQAARDEQLRLKNEQAAGDEQLRLKNEQAARDEQLRLKNEQAARDLRELTRSIQIELARLGCSPGQADGLWGRKSKLSLGAYFDASSQKNRLPEVSNQVLRELRKVDQISCTSQSPVIRGKPIKKDKCVPFAGEEFCG